MDSLNIQQQAKSFWKRPEGKVGIAFLVGMFAFSGLGLVANLTAIIAAITLNIFTAGASLVGLVLLWLVITSPRVHNLLSYMFRGAMWHATNFFVDLDPVMILKGYVSKLKDHIENYDEQLGKLRGYIVELKNELTRNAAAIQENLGMASAAQTRENSGAFRLHGQQVTRLKKETAQMQAWLSKLESMYAVMSKIREHANLKMKDIDFEVASALKMRKTSKVMGSAISSAIAIIKGGQASEMYDAAHEKIQQDYALEVGRFEDFLASTSDLMSSIDLRGDVETESVMQMLNDWEQKSTLMIEGPKLERNVMDIPFKEKSSTRSFLDVTNLSNPQ